MGTFLRHRVELNETTHQLASLAAHHHSSDVFLYMLLATPSHAITSDIHLGNVSTKLTQTSTKRAST